MRVSVVVPTYRRPELLARCLAALAAQDFDPKAVEVIVADTSGHIDLGVALGLLGERGLTRLLIEGGGRLAAALLRADLVDRLVWINAPMLIGGDGVPAIAALGIERLSDAPHFEHVATEIVGGDVLSRFRARRDQAADAPSRN